MPTYTYPDPIPIVLMSDIQEMLAKPKLRHAGLGIKLEFPIHLDIAEQDREKALPRIDNIWAWDAESDEDSGKPTWAALRILDSKLRSSAESLGIGSSPINESISSPDSSSESRKDTDLVLERASSSDSEPLETDQSRRITPNETNPAAPNPPVSTPSKTKAKIPSRLRLSKPLPPLPLDARLSAASAGSQNTIYYLRQREQIKDYFSSITHHPLNAPLPSSSPTYLSHPSHRLPCREPAKDADHRQGQIHRVPKGFIRAQAFALCSRSAWIETICRVFGVRLGQGKTVHPGPWENVHASSKCMQKGCKNWQRTLIKKCGRCALLLCDDCVWDGGCPGKKKGMKEKTA